MNRTKEEERLEHCSVTCILLEKGRIYLFVRIVLDGEKDVSKGTFSDLLSDSIALHAMRWNSREVLKVARSVGW